MLSFRGKKTSDLLLTTNHIVFETVTPARARLTHDYAVQVSQALLTQTVARIHWATEDDQREALAYCRTRRVLRECAREMSPL